METDLLAKAREYEAKYGSLITAEERPVYHVTPTVGWLNDPNGLSYYDGKYHLFTRMTYTPSDYSYYIDTWGHAIGTITTDDDGNCVRGTCACAYNRCVGYATRGAWVHRR